MDEPYDQEEIPSARGLAEARQMLYDLLLSPYTQMNAWAITRACTYLEHPMRPPLPNRQPTSCICGMVKGAA